jgi:hypothetical protein
VLGAGERRFIRVNANHLTGSGAWDFVLVLDCEAPRPRLAFKEAFRYGAHVVESTPVQLVLETGSWSKRDANCCPSGVVRLTYRWQTGSRRYVLVRTVSRPSPGAATSGGSSTSSPHSQRGTPAPERESADAVRPG